MKYYFYIEMNNRDSFALKYNYEGIMAHWQNQGDSTSSKCKPEIQVVY